VIEIAEGKFKRYYFNYLIPLVIFALILFISKLPLIQIAIFIFFYLWNLVLQTKSLREQFLQSKMRFSFVRQLLNFELICLKIFRNTYLARLVELVLYSIFFNLCFGMMSIIFVFAGAICNELVILVISKKSIQNKVANS
jgi:hypothetical protein